MRYGTFCYSVSSNDRVRHVIILFSALICLRTAVPDGTAAILVLTNPTDTSILSGNGVNPRGDQSILAGTRGRDAQGEADRGLFRFDLASIPTNATIQSVTLTLTVVQAPQRPVPSNFELFRLLTAWDETATWNLARALVPWAAPGAKEGVDYVATVSASVEVDDLDAYDFGPSDQLKADVQQWIVEPASNQGWLLKSDSEGAFFTARHFGSSESSDPPQLAIAYSLPGAGGPTLTDPRARTNQFTFSFVPVSGQTYAIESRTNLTLGSWIAVMNIPASTTPNAIVVTNSLSAREEFFRVKLQ
jgi:hypothetical protein